MPGSVCYCVRVCQCVFVSVCAHALMYLLEPHVRFLALLVLAFPPPSDAWLIAALESHHGDVTA